MKACLLGAESTGKTTLAQQLAAHLRGQGGTAAVAPEVLRQWCAAHGRTPDPAECIAIARAQETQADALAASHDHVIADTCALVVTVYAGMLQPGGEAYRFSIGRLRAYDAVLLMGLDLPWVPDGLHRDAGTRTGVDAQLRSILQTEGIGHRVVYGSGPARLEAALHALGLGPPRTEPPRAARPWSCEACSDPECEHRLFRRLLG